MNKKKCVKGLTPLILFSLLFIPPVHASKTDQLRNNLVTKARAGELDSSITGLKQLYKDTNDAKVLNDLIVITSWDNNYKEAASATDNCYNKNLSNDAIEVLAKAFREEKHYQKSIDCYTILSEKKYNNKNAWLGLALVSAESHDSYNANKYIQHYRDNFPKNRNFYHSWVHTSRANNDKTGEMHAWLDWHNSEPDNKEAGRGLYKSAMAIDATPAISKLMKNHPEWFSEPEITLYEYQDTAASLRNSNNAHSSDQGEQTILTYENLLNSTNKEHPSYEKIEYDYFNALISAHEYEKASPLAKKLSKRNEAFLSGKKNIRPIPNYALENLGDYYLETGYPSKSKNIFSALYAKYPNSQSIQTKLYFSLMHTEQYDDAYTLILNTINVTPKTKWDFTGRIKTINNHYQDILKLEVMHFLYRGDIKTASKKLDALMDFSPGNPYLLAIKAEIELEKSNPDKAEEYFQQGRRLVTIQSKGHFDRGIYSTKMSRGQWNDLDDDLKVLNNTYSKSDQAGINNAKRKWSSPMLFAEYRRSNGDQSSSITSPKEWVFDARLYSSRFSTGDRIFFRHQQRYGEYNSNDLEAAYTGLGAELVFYPITFILEAGKGSELNDQNYYWGSLNYRISDRWNANISYKNNSDQTPLRALNDDINVNDFSGYVTYKISNKFVFSVSGSAAEFSDSNERYSYGGSLQKQLFRTDFYTLDGSIGYRASDNKPIDTATYFNPDSDATSTLSISQNYHHWLTGSLALDQALNTSVSLYKQENFSSDINWDLNYSHKWRVRNNINFSYGIGVNKGTYDGDSEHATYLFANLYWRFE